MTALPPGFVRHEVGDVAAVLRSDVAAALLRAGVSNPESLRESAHACYDGRGRAFAVDVPGAGRVFVRAYLHGGALRRVTSDLHAGEGRFLGELDALLAASRAGVPTPEALGVVSRRAGLGLRRGWLLLRQVEGAIDLGAFLAARPAPARRRAVLAAAGRAIRALHDAGLDHPDLHLKNMLLTTDDTVLVLDLDRARPRESLSRNRRLTGLFRFDRYAAKQAAAGLPVTRADRLRVLRAYAGDGWPPREEVRALARRLARHIAAHEALRSRAEAVR